MRSAARAGSWLKWPEKIIQASYDELSDWIELQLKKIARINALKRRRLSGSSSPVRPSVSSRNPLYLRYDFGYTPQHIDK